MLLQDLRYAIRQLRRAPGFTLAAVLTLALGIASLTTVFTWIKAVLFNPWPHVREPRTVRFVDATVRGSEGYSVHFDQIEYLRQRSTTLENATAFALNSLDVATPGSQPETVIAGQVSSNYFDMLGLTPQVGRFFDRNANDRVFGSHDEVVLSDGEWREHFGADRQIVGRVVQVNRKPFTVIGVAPREFRGIFGGMAEAMWVPLSSLRTLQAEPTGDPLEHMGLQVGARLKAGTTDAAASAELHSLARVYAREKNFSGWDLNLRDSAHFERGLFGVIGEQMPILLGASGLLLLLVCVNTASLMGQRAVKRRREIAIRASLGATSKRIAGQLLCEALVLAAMGGVVGWMASLVLSRSLYAMLPTFGIPLTFNLSTDFRILGFVAVVVLAVAMLCAMMPIRQALRGSQKDALHEGSQGIVGTGRARWTKTAALGLQLGLCFVVLASCALLMRSLTNVLHRARGFDRENTMTAMISLGRSGYTGTKGIAFQTALLEQLRAVPGVAQVTMTTHLPMGDDGSGNTWDFDVPGYKWAPNEGKEVVTDLEGPEYFQTMRIPLVQGREFTAQDREGAPAVVMISEDMAHRYWPNGNALGSTFMLEKKPVQVVGIVGHYAYYNPSDTDPLPVVFVPLLQHYSSHFFVAARSRTSAEALGPAMMHAVAKLDGALPIEQMQTLASVTETRYQLARVPVELLGVYALASLLVATLGLYAVMAYAVLERSREFALRMAVGATRGQIVRLVVNGGLETAAVGLLIGGVGSFFAVRLLRSILFGVSAFDPWSFAAAAAVLVLTVLLAGVAPARRAAGIEPMQVLKSE